MAIYHIGVKTIGRSAGKSAVASAAWRSRETLFDERLGKKHKYSHFKDLVDSDILIPGNAPERWKDRATLWNEVERAEKRIDSQLARVIEIAIPLELDREQQIDLVREFAQTSFVQRGMIADIALIAKEANPYATIMLTTRVISAEGFGQKETEWNKKELLFRWRKEWADIQNKKLEEAGCDVRVDHRSYVELGIDLEPQIKIGVAAKYLPVGNDFLKSTRGFDRLEEYQRIRKENGERIIEAPLRALKLLKQKAGVFKRRDLERFAKYYSVNAEQYKHVLNALECCPSLLCAGQNKRGEDLFTIRESEEENN
jgi:ATP-dependent exoDNAse (exonuclease V) alpha subunit